MEVTWTGVLLAVVCLVILKVVRKPESPLEWETGRRKARKPYKKDAQYYAKFGVRSEEEYIQGRRGVELFTKRWLPLDDQYKGVVFYCHGYGDTCTYLFEDVAIRLACAQYAVVSMDYEGHGQSQGRHVYIKRFDNIVDDVSDFCDSLKKSQEYQGLPFFLYGESMGGAVALETVLRDQSGWSGAILLAPMCKIADHMYPPAIVVIILKLLARVFPLWKAVPTRDICKVAFRVPEKRVAAVGNPVAYMSKPRLGTGVQLLKTTDDIAAKLMEVVLPLLILHGGGDVVTDPSVSQALYEQAMSKDKTFHLYPNSWHALIAGEPDDVVDQVMRDITTWLDGRSVPVGGLSKGYPASAAYLEEDAISTVTGQ